MTANAVISVPAECTPKLYKDAKNPGNPKMTPTIGSQVPATAITPDSARPVVIEMKALFDVLAMTATLTRAIMADARTPHPSNHWCRSCSGSPHPALVALK